MKRLSRPGTIINQSGTGKLGCLFTFTLVGVLGFAAYKFAPPFVSHYQLSDAMKEIATLSAAGVLPEPGAPSGRTTGSVSAIQEAVMVKARELEIPLRKEDIKVRREGGIVFISVKYTVPIDLIGGVYNYDFEFTSHN